MTRRRLLLAAATVAVVGVGVLALAGILQLAHRGEVVPSVTLVDERVGGLSTDDARERVAALAKDLRDETVTVTWEGDTWKLDPSDVGFAIDVDATVDGLQAVGRDRGTLANLLGHLTTLWRTEETDLVAGVDEAKFDDWLSLVSGSIDQAPYPGGFTVDDESFEVTTEQPREGRAVDLAVLGEAVVNALMTRGDAAIEVPVSVDPIRISIDQVEAVAEQARAALAEPLLLTHELGDLEVARSDLAALLTLREVEVEDEDAWHAELHVDAGSVEEVFATRTGRYEVEPIDATWEVARKPPVGFDEKSTTTWRKVPQVLDVVASQEGSTFDVDRTAAQISDMARRESRTEPLELLTIEPDFTTAEADQGRPTHMLSTFTTHHACCQSRVHNIQRLANMVDGAIVHPGEQFSINQISGERLCSKGFVEAGMIRRGEIVPSCGGGVSQFGTTTFNAAWFAGMQLDEWKAHSFYISRYPQGREATINYPSPDLDVLWTNITDTPILVKTSHTATSITVTFWGRSDIDEVEAIHGQPTRWTNWSTEYRENKDLKPGQERTIQSGQRGFTVVVTRRVHRGNDVEEQEVVTKYVPERQIVERNTDPVPEPSPTPDPDADPSQSPKPTETPTPDPSPSESASGEEE